MIRALHLLAKMLLPDRHWQRWLEWRYRREAPPTQERPAAAPLSDVELEDPFLSMLAATMTAAIDHPGDAAAAVPMMDVETYVIRNGCGDIIRTMQR